MDLFFLNFRKFSKNLTSIYTVWELCCNCTVKSATNFMTSVFRCIDLHDGLLNVLAPKAVAYFHVMTL